MTHHALVSNARLAKESMVPQEITSTDRPNPKKLSVDSISMADPIEDTTINIMGDQILGHRWQRRIYNGPAPIKRAAHT